MRCLQLCVSTRATIIQIQGICISCPVCYSLVSELFSIFSLLGINKIEAIKLNLKFSFGKGLSIKCQHLENTEVLSTPPWAFSVLGQPPFQLSEDIQDQGLQCLLSMAGCCGQEGHLRELGHSYRPLFLWSLLKYVLDYREKHVFFHPVGRWWCVTARRGPPSPFSVLFPYSLFSRVLSAGPVPDGVSLWALGVPFPQRDVPSVRRFASGEFRARNSLWAFWHVTYCWNSLTLILIAVNHCHEYYRLTGSWFSSRFCFEWN